MPAVLYDFGAKRPFFRCTETSTDFTSAQMFRERSWNGAEMYKKCFLKNQRTNIADIW